MSKDKCYHSRDFLKYDEVEEDKWNDGTLKLHKVLDEFSDEDAEKPVKLKKVGALLETKSHPHILRLESYDSTSKTCVVENFYTCLSTMVKTNPNYFFRDGKCTTHFMQNIRGLIDALGFLHKQGIIHGSIDVENIWCDKTDALRLRFNIEDKKVKVKEKEKIKKILKDWRYFGLALQMVKLLMPKLSKLVLVDPEYESFYTFLIQPVSIEFVYDWVYNQPLFWDNDEKAELLVNFVDTLNSSSGTAGIFLESKANKSLIFPKGASPWSSNIRSDLYDHMTTFHKGRSYDTTSVCNYLQFIRNCMQHADEIPELIRNGVGGSREEIFKYFYELNPSMMVELHKLIVLLKWKLSACNFLTNEYHIEL